MSWVSQETMQAAIAMTGVGLLGKIVWDFFTVRRSKNGNGKNAETVEKLTEEVHNLGVKVDNLRVEIAGNYAKRSDVTDMQTEVRAMRDIVVRAETKAETLERQVSEAFRRINKGE